VIPPTAAAIEKRIRRACARALVALSLIVWSLVNATPLLLFGTLSFAWLVYVTLAEAPRRATASILQPAHARGQCRTRA
jgi:hypothetical protein